jgi:hypothetical protein
VGGGPSPAARTVAAGRTLAVTLWSWHTMPRRAAEYLIEHRPDARFLVFGHLHRPGVWRFGERVLVNTGGYGSPARPRAVVLEGDTLSVHAVIRTAHGHSLSARPAARFPVTPRPAATPPPAAAASSVGSADRGPEAAPAPAGRVVPTPRRRRAA